MLLNINFRRHLTLLRSYLRELNLFQSGIKNESVIRNERRSTHLYLILSIISFIIIAFYYSIESRENTIVIKSPSFVKYSSLPKGVSLQCPCATLAVKYKQFVAIEPVYHELCESDFISERFLQQLLALYKKTWNNSIQTDFHRIAIFQFKTLGIFCQLIQETIKHAVETFLQTDFIQSHLLAQDFFQNHIELLLRDFVALTPKTFLRTLTFIQDITAQNLFMTGASITSVLSFSRRNPTFNDFGNLPFHGINYIFSDNSSCQCTSSTANSCMGLATFKNDSVLGFYTGCYMVSALLKSTLEILYNQTMIDSLTNSSNTFQKLNLSASNSTIKTLLTQMFIIHWSNKTSFEQYFNNCASTSCQYTIIQGNSFLLIVTLLIGLYGGLSSVLSIICPIIIKAIWPFIRKLIVRRRRTIATQDTNNGISRETSVNDRIKQFFQVLKQKLIELNLFKSIPPTDDINILQQQYTTTRLYLICVLLAVIILTVFTAMRLPKIRVTIRSPSLEDFIYLYDQYQLSLNCPCNQISIENRLISYIMPHYHEVCSSKFVTSAWINIQFVQNSSKLLYTHDIRYHSQFYFQLLSTLCRIANQTVYDSLESFYQTKFISNQALNSQTFETRINILVEQFKKTVPESFERSLNLLTANFEINQFVSSMNSIVAKYDLTVNGTYIPQLEMYVYYWYKKSKCNPNELVGLHDCLCIPMGFDECRREIVISEGETTHVIPGMYQGWFPLHIFVSPRWLESLIGPSFYGLLRMSYGDDYRALIHVQFQTIAKLCKLSKIMLNISISRFEQTDFFTANVISNDEFNLRIELLIEQFKQTTFNQFMETFKLIQLINHGNQLATVLLKDMLAVPQQYGVENCSCDVQSNCSKYPGIYVENPKKLFTETIPGFLVGCLPLNALLQSNLDCLFNETCLSIMRAFIFYVNPIPFEVLKYSSLAIPNTTIDTILNQLFVSNWLQNTSFDLYFNQCAPQLCQYSYLIEYNTVYVATTLIALFGGLTIGLRLFVHYTALIIHKIADNLKKKNRIVPNIHESDITPISTTTKVQNDIIAIVIGDFNNDGIESDMALCTHDRRLITILYNSSNSDHYSRPSQTLLTNEYPSKMTKGKFNDDEIDDIVIISFHSNTLQVQLSFGNGNFLTQIYLTDVYPTSITVINFNDDKIDDLAILHCNGAVSVFLGLKIGIFNRHYLSFQNYTTINGKCAQSLRVIDLNQDGRDDVVFVDPEMNVIRLLLGSQCDE
ncbi:hypothetical protein I4U23_017150 [Adineta vaga]|nr:hypothetical protein I4U23_017150 [Adineta vaga]